MKYFYPLALTFLLTSSLLLITSCSLSPYQTKQNTNTGQKGAYTYLEQLTSTTLGIGAREAGTEQEKKTARYIKANFENFGYRVTEQNFSFNNRKVEGESQNIIAELGDSSKPTIILGAHYDSTAMKIGSMGAIDNGAGVAAMLAIAEALADRIPQNYNIRFIAFGAEEIGLQGSNY